MPFDGVDMRAHLGLGALGLVDHARRLAEADQTDPAREMAIKCAAAISRHSLHGLADAERIALKAGATLPDGDNEARAVRLASPRWWSRQLKRIETRRAESMLRNAGHVKKGAAVYLSEAILEVWRERQRQSDLMMQSAMIESEAGDLLSLADVAATTVANPAIRRGELMTRARGCEELAKAANHAGLFLTFTAPARFHRWTASGAPNPAHKGETPRDAQAWLCAVWARIRARLKRLCIEVYGFRIAEPHDDGCTHWHLLVFTSQGNARAVENVCKFYLLAELPADPVAAIHRRKYAFKSVRIDPNKGSAAGYLTKYIAKNVDGFSTAPAEEATDGAAGDGAGGHGVTIEEGAERVRAWASLWGIRQFQPIGQARVTIWRELRRVRAPIETDTAGALAIEQARAAADAGDWHEFSMTVAGLRLWRIETDEPDQYGGPRQPQVIGVDAGAFQLETRPIRWRITFAPPAATAAWTRENNCTPPGGLIPERYTRPRKIPAPPGNSPPLFH